MSLCGTWHQRILEAEPAVGTLMGRERLGCPAAAMGRQCLGEVWGKQAVRLLQLPGFGVIVTMTVLSAIGDISRFESAKKQEPKNNF